MGSLTAAFPADALCAEETTDTLSRASRSGPRLWIIDPHRLVQFTAVVSVPPAACSSSGRDSTRTVSALRLSFLVFSRLFIVVPLLD